MQYTPKLTHSQYLKYLWIGICLIFSGKSFSQFTPSSIEQLGNFLDDFALYSQKYITPATDAAVYQASSGWVNSPKKRQLFDVTIGLHSNFFFVPKSDRDFKISNTDFKFFTIENATSTTVPTAIGQTSQVTLVGAIDDNSIRVKTPDGINQSMVFYPYLQGEIALWSGFEVVGKYSTKVKLKTGDYQVYGFGVKHSISQYLPSLDQNNIYLSVLFGYSNEKIGFNFFDVNSSMGNLGIDRISGNVNTGQFQLSASKSWKNFELMFSSITNVSDFSYHLSGGTGSLDAFIPVKQILNEKLKEIYTTKINSIGEISGRYQFNKIYVQTLFAFGKFANANVSVQYEFK